MVLAVWWIEQNHVKVSQYDQEMPQSHTNPRHREERPQNTISQITLNYIKLKQPVLSSTARLLQNKK